MTTEGDYKVCVELSDYANNPTVYGSSPTFTLKLPPVFTSLLGANEASDNTVTNAEVGSTSPIVALVASSFTTATYTDILDNTPAQVCDGLQTYGNASIPLINTMPGLDDDYVVCVRLVDYVGQETFGTSAVISRDGSYILPNLSEFSATSSTTSNTPGSIDISITYPPVLEDINNVQIYRASGATAPANDCASGTLVHTFTGPVANGSDLFTDTGLTSGSFYSYRACVRDALDNYNTNFPIHIQENIEASYVHTLITTSTTYTGAGVGGTIGADAKCQAAGNVLDNTLTWKALISDSGLDAKTRIAVRGPIFNNNSPAQSPFSSASELWDAANRPLPFTINWDENGTDPGNQYVWTGTTGAGLRAPDHCSNWSSTAGNGTTGRLNRTDEQWLSEINTACSNARRLYCISQPNTAALDGFTAVTGSLSREIDLSIDFPLDTSEYDRVEVRRKQGSVAPDENCDSDTLVATLNSFADWGPYVDNTGLSGGEFSYRVCVFDADNVLARSETLTGVFAQGSVVAALSVTTDTTQSTSDNILVRIDYPTDITEIDRVEVRRTTGATGPADCSTGSLVHTFSSPTSGGFEEWVDSGLTGGSYSYRACEYDGLGGERTEPANLIEDVRPSFMHWVFVSSGTYLGNFGGLSGADSICTTLGASLDSSVKWRAILSDSNTSVSTRFWSLDGIWDSNSGIKTKIQTTMANLFDAGTDLLSGFNYDESGLALSGSSFVWTGSTASGLKSNADCDNWTSTLSSLDGTEGVRNSTTSTWLSNDVRRCDRASRIACMSLPDTAELTAFTAVSGTSAGEIDLDVDFPVDASDFALAEVRRLSGNTAPDGDCSSGDLVQSFVSFSDWQATDSGLTPGAVYSYRVCAFDSDNNALSSIAVSGVSATGTPSPHRVFASSLTYTGNLGGLSGADSKCQALAVAQSLGGTWKALLSDSSTNVKDRIAISAQVELLDGTVIANDFADMWDGSITNSLNRDETNAAIGGAADIWTGADEFGGSDANHCNNWTNGTNSYDGNRGRTNTTSASWINRSSAGCSATNRIYCIDGQ